DSEFNAQTNVALYPNPAYTEFSISIADEQEQVRSIRIYDSYGKLVLEPVVNDLGRYSIEDIGTSGFYTVVIETTSSVISRPLVKLME
ncbi:MAG: T9SS type A sorting domain-containing protein, partial [Salibacteraceae bacterium]